MAHAFASTLKNFKTAFGKIGKLYSLLDFANVPLLDDQHLYC